MTIPPALDPDRLDALWDFRDPAGSEQRFRDELATVTDSVAAELTTQLARALGLQGRFAEADRLLDSIDPARYPPVVGVRWNLERGRVRNSAGNPSEAVPLFRAALDAAVSAGDDFLAVDAAHMLAITDPDLAADWTRRGLAMVRASVDPRCAHWAGALHNNLGWSRHDAGDYRAALSEFEAALAAYRATGTAEQVRAARWSVGRCLRSLGRLHEALALQNELAAGPSDGYVEQELAELLLALGRPAAADRYRAVAAEKLSGGRA